MAVRTPVYFNGSDIQEMSASMITAIIQRCTYLFAGNPSVNLSYVTNNGSLRRMLDLRDLPGTEDQNNTSFGSNNPGNTRAEASESAVTFDKINLVTDTVSQQTDTNSRLYPLYLDGTDLHAMNRQDMLDTFIEPAIDLLVDGNPRGGTYIISSSNSIADHTLVNSQPVFTDTIYNINFFGGTGDNTEEILPYDSDAAGQSVVTTNGNYYLHKQNQGLGIGDVAVTKPLFVNSDEDLEEYSSANFDSMLQYLIRDAAVNVSGYRIKYEVEAGVGSETLDVFSISDNVSTPQAKGSATNKTLNGQHQINDQDDDVYRSINFPAGSEEVNTTYTLKIYRF